MNVSRIAAALGAVAATAVLVGNAVAADFGSRQPLPPPVIAVSPVPLPIYVPAPPYVVEPVNYHCMRWSDICDSRWGFGSPRFARCMWRHDC